MKRKKISNEEISEEEIKEWVRKELGLFIENMEKINTMIEKEMFDKEVTIAYPFIYIVEPHLENTLDIKKNRKLLTSVVDVNEKLTIVIEVNSKDYEIKIKNKKLTVNSEEGVCEIELPDNVILDKRREEYNNGILTIIFEKKK